jgi:hypothetical protein
VGEIAAKAVVQLFPMRKASTWSTQVREAETHSTQFAPFFKEIENMHMAHDLLHQ